MVCTKCGKSIEKGRKYCGFCGAEVKEAEPKSNKRHTAVLAIISIAAVLFVVAAVIFMCMDFFPNQSTYTTVIEKGLKAIQEIDVDEYIEILPEAYIKYNINENYKTYNDMLDSYEEMLWNENRVRKKDYGSDFKIVYEIKSEVFYRDEKDLSKLTKEYNNKYNSNDKIEEAVKAAVVTEMKSLEASGTSETTEMCFIKIDGVWYLDIDRVTELLT